MMFQFLLSGEIYVIDGEKHTNKINGIIAFDTKTMFIRIEDHPVASFEVLHIRNNIILIRHKNDYGTLVIREGEVELSISGIRVRYAVKQTNYKNDG